MLNNTLLKIKRVHSSLAKRPTGAFTVVELIVVIAVIGILAGVVIVSYGAWQTSIQTAQVKNDLTQASTAMQSASSFGTGYPSSLPSSFSVTDGDIISLFSSTNSTFCIDGTSNADSSILYYIDETHVKDQKAQSGSCATRPANAIPAAPTNLAVTGYSTTVTLSWTAPSGIVSSYNLQCAEDASFTINMKQSSSVSTSGSVSGVNPQTSQFCRVGAVNSLGAGPWSAVASVDTNELTPPVGLAASTVTFSSITLTWSTNPDATSYNIQCAKDTGYSVEMVANTVSATTTQMNGLTPNTTYHCHINMVGGTGTSRWSSDITTGTSDSYGSLAAGSSIEGYWTSAPTGYLLEDGSAVSRTQYSDLFAVIGTTYGSGNGSTTFNLPDSRGRTVVSQNPSDSEFATMGEKYGSKTDVQTVAELPVHTHIQNPHDHNNGASNPYVTTGQFGGIAVTSANGTAFGFMYNVAPSATATNQYTGGSAAHNIVQPSIVKMNAIKYTLPDSTASTLSAGSSIHGYWSSAPSGYLLENGSAVSRTTYASLFSAIGTTYGSGDGSTTFNLPDSRGRAAVNLSSSDSEFNTMGEKYGEKTHVMTILEMPSHTHIQNPHDHNNGASNPYVTDGSFGGVDVSSANGSYYGFMLSKSPATTATNQTTGSGQAENIIQPSIVQMSAIKYTAATTGTSVAVAIGTSVPGYWPSVPSGYLAEDGSAVSRTGYAALFAAIGTTYGAGNGSTTFNLPDSRGRLAVNLSPSDSEFNTMGEKYGEKTHLMTIAEMASHTHIQNPHDHNGGGSVPYVSDGSFGGNAAPTANGTAFGFHLAKSPSATATNQSTGGGQVFNVIQPSIVKLFVIKY